MSDGSSSTSAAGGSGGGGSTLLIAAAAAAVSLVMAVGLLMAVVGGVQQASASDCVAVVDLEFGATTGAATGKGSSAQRGTSGGPAAATTSTMSTTPTAAGAALPEVEGWSAEQVGNAAAIIAAGAELGVPARAQRIAVMTAIGESTLRVLDYGDDAGPDSRGLFQQRANGAWGSLSDRMDPRISSLNFYKALLQVDGWESLPPTIAAHRTQRNADPYHYEPYWEPAGVLLAALAGVPVSDTTGALGECAPAATAAGEVTWPLAPDLAKSSDRHNWGNSGGSWDSWHTGTDFSVSCGTPVYASHAGTIEVDTTQGWAGRWLVKVSSGPGKLTTWYAHMQALSVTNGQVVSAGQQLGDVGAEGNATGCHLHFEVHTKGGSIYGSDNVDPSKWLAENVGKVIIGVAVPALDQAVGTVSSFRVASFNVLGHSHTTGNQRNNRFASGPVRMRGSVALLNALQISVVGLQEFQQPQVEEFRRLTSPQSDRGSSPPWRVFYPKGHTANAVAWRTDTWSLVATRTVTVPYFYGNPTPMPAVLLEHNTTGAQVWVLSVHNPADARGPAQHLRDRAIAVERAAVTEFGQRAPVILTGDLNDREEAFCPLTAGGLMASATGGSNTPANGCQPPAVMPVDWVFATAGVTFEGSAISEAPEKYRLSDHPLIVAQAHLN